MDQKNAMNEFESMREEKITRSRFNPALRIISATLVFTFLAQDFVQAQGGTPLWSTVIDAKRETKSSGEDKLNKIAIPFDSGLARKVVVKGTEDVIINIQDAHSKLGAQESISRILESLVKNYNLNFIALEGAADVVDTSLVSSFPIEEVRKTASDYLLKEGKISAGEFYSMVSKEPVRLYGVEDPALYQENLEAFRAVVERKTEIRAQLTNLRKALAALEDKVFSPALKEMVSRKLLHKNGDIKFTDYWDYFSKIAAEHGIDY